MTSTIIGWDQGAADGSMSMLTLRYGAGYDINRDIERYRRDGWSLLVHDTEARVAQLYKRDDPHPGLTRSAS